MQGLWGVNKLVCTMQCATWAMLDILEAGDSEGALKPSGTTARSGDLGSQRTEEEGHSWKAAIALRCATQKLSLNGSVLWSVWNTPQRPRPTLPQGREGGSFKIELSGGRGSQPQIGNLRSRDIPESRELLPIEGSAEQLSRLNH